MMISPIWIDKDNFHYTCISPGVSTDISHEKDLNSEQIL